MKTKINDTTCTIYLEGNVLDSNFLELREQIRRYIFRPNYDTIVLDCNGIQTMDFEGMRIFYSSAVCARSIDKAFYVDGLENVATNDENVEDRKQSLIDEFSTSNLLI